MVEKKKLYILTGFLGAGKTTVLQNILETLKDRKVGIIQNEFGKLGIDGDILRKDGIEMVEISRGSIFCSCLKLSFVQALSELGKMDLEYVFVESSGLADPSNIEEILNAVKQLAGDFYELKGVICLIDGVNFPEQLKDVETVDRQLAHCHLALINKTDLIDETQLSAVISEVKKVNPVCRLQVCCNGEIGSDFLNENLMENQWAQCEDSLNKVDNKPKTISLEFDGIIEKAVLTEFLEGALQDCYRIKGFFHLKEGWMQVDVVGRLIDYKPCEEKEASQLVFLSKVGPKVIRTVDAAWRNATDLPMKLKN
jgi:G3E family GTPase